LHDIAKDRGQPHIHQRIGTRLNHPKFIASREKPSENRIDKRKTLFLADENDRREGVENFPLDSLMQKTNTS
jgi:hypothetical protein